VWRLVWWVVLGVNAWAVYPVCVLAVNEDPCMLAGGIYKADTRPHTFGARVNYVVQGYSSRFARATTSRIVTY